MKLELFTMDSRVRGSDIWVPPEGVFLVNIHALACTRMYERAPNLSLRGSFSDQSNLNGVRD